MPWDFFTFPEFPYELAPGDLAARAEAQDFPSGEIVQVCMCVHVRVFGRGVRAWVFER